MRLLIALAMIANAGPAAAYVLKDDGEGHPVRWAQPGPIPFAIDAAGARDIPMADAELAVRRAFDAWTRAPGTAIRFRYQGRIRGLEVGYDRGHPEANRNAVVWSRGDWKFEPDALAITLSLFHVHSGALVDADIVVNEKSFRWGVGEAADNDLQNALTHEVGHFLGLAHSPVRDSTMYAHADPHELAKRDLHPDDIAGAQKLYPAPKGGQSAQASTARPPSYGGAYRDDAVPAPVIDPASQDTAAAPRLGCAAVPAGPPYGLWTVLVVLGGLRGRRRARSQGEGR
jgi:hypothetical protein